MLNTDDYRKSTADHDTAHPSIRLGCDDGDGDDDRIQRRLFYHHEHQRHRRTSHDRYLAGRRHSSATEPRAHSSTASFVSERQASCLRQHERIQSANNKIDDIVAMKRERDLDVLCLCETWHDQDTVSIRRLRAEGLQVLECARPRPSDTMPSISTNHGGVALAASRCIRLTAINTGG